MWKAVVDGQVLHFELSGINNQNFIMHDVETGSWWQQITGEAILGPLKGKRLELAPWDEVSFEIWRQEHPDSLVLAPDEKYTDRYNFYKGPDWEAYVEELPTVVPADPDDPLRLREVIVGIEIDGAAKAYPLAVLAQQSPVVDELAGTPLVVVVGGDGKSVRCFSRTIGGQVLDLYRKAEEEGALRLVDAQTGSEWDFSGRAVAGPLAGSELERIQTLKDYWFDWRLYHPETEVFSAGL